MSEPLYYYGISYDTLFSTTINVIIAVLAYLFFRKPKEILDHDKNDLLNLLDLLENQLTLASIKIQENNPSIKDISNITAYLSQYTFDLSTKMNSSEFSKFNQIYDGALYDKIDIIWTSTTDENLLVRRSFYNYPPSLIKTLYDTISDSKRIITEMKYKIRRK